MATIENRSDFERWLDGRPRDVAVVLAARIAMRVLPLIGGWKPAGDDEISQRYQLTLSTLRASAAPWAVARYPAHGEVLRLASVAVTSASRASASASASRASASLAAASATAATAATATASLAASAASTSSADIWRAIEADAVLIERGMRPLKLADRPLWLNTVPGTWMPDWISDGWAELKSDLLSQKADWYVWIDWYEDRLAGKRPRRAGVEVFRVTLNEEADWEKGPAHVNALIKAKIAEKREEERQRREEKRRPAHVATIIAEAIERLPLPTPAALEPVVIDERLTLPNARPILDLDDTALLAELAALKAEITDLVAAVNSEPPQIDKRPAAYLADLSRRIPDVLPAQFDLHRIAVALDVMDGLSAMITAEWRTVHAAQFRALRLHIERALRQFPHMRDFFLNAVIVDATPEQARQAVVGGLAIATELRNKALAPFVDPIIPDRLEVLSAPIDERLKERESQADPGPVSRNRAIADEVESVSNILKRIAEWGLSTYLFHIQVVTSSTTENAAKAGKFAIGTAVGGTMEFAKGFGKTFPKEMRKQGEKTGTASAKAIGKFFRAAFASDAAGHALITAFPNQLGWLDPQMLALLSGLTGTMLPEAEVVPDEDAVESDSSSEN